MYSELQRRRPTNFREVKMNDVFVMVGAARL